MDTCGGYCCERFRFRYNESPEQLKKDASLSAENTQIAEMVIYLGQGGKDVDGDEGHPETHWYTCKNFDTETRLCKIYETRPKMCRSYNSEWWNACGLKKCRMPPPIKPNSESLEVIKEELPGG